MALRDRYAGVASPSVASSPTPAPSAPSQAASAPSFPPIVSVLGTRDLEALRTGLARGNTAPPEAAAALTEAAFEPKTRELPDGTAEPLVSALPETAGSASPAVGPLPSTPTTEQAKRKRRTKAEMEAARAASTPKAESPEAQPTREAGAPIEERELSVTDFSLRTRLDSITTDQLLGELLQRAQVGL